MKSKITAGGKAAITSVPASLLICSINIIIGNGCGVFEFTKGQRYPLSRLESDCRLSPTQIRSYFHAGAAK